MKKIEGTLKNVARYQYDGISIDRPGGLDRAGAYLYVAELSAPELKQESHKTYLLQRSFVFAAFKENQKVILSVAENSRQMKAFEFLRGLPYLCKTDQPIRTLLNPSDKNTFVSGTVLDVHTAKTRWNSFCEKMYWMIILAGFIGVYFLLSSIKAGQP